MLYLSYTHAEDVQQKLVGKSYYRHSSQLLLETYLEAFDWLDSALHSDTSYSGTRVAHFACQSPLSLCKQVCRATSRKCQGMSTRCHSHMHLRLSAQLSRLLQIQSLSHRWTKLQLRAGPFRLHLGSLRGRVFVALSKSLAWVASTQAQDSRSRRRFSSRCQP